MNRNSLYVICSILILLATAGILSAALAFAPRADRTPREANGCPRDFDDLATSVLLVDYTDLPTPAHLSQLERGFRQLRRSVPRNGRAIVAMLDPTAATFVSITTDVCNPGTKSGAYTDRPTPARLDQLWLHTFVRPLDAALEDLRRGAVSSDTSPIFEAITYLTQSASFDGGVPERRLVIVSDGLQLTPGVYSQFSKGDLVTNYERSGLADRVQADLTEVDVEFIYLFRPEFAHRQTAKHRAFLRQWFLSHGARSFTLRGISNGEAD